MAYPTTCKGSPTDAITVAPNEGVPPGGALMHCGDASTVLHHPVYGLLRCRCGCFRWYARYVNNFVIHLLYCAECGLDIKEGLLHPGPHPMEDVAGGD
jgi:hypothetical protein